MFLLGIGELILAGCGLYYLFKRPEPIPDTVKYIELDEQQFNNVRTVMNAHQIEPLYFGLLNEEVYVEDLQVQGPPSYNENTFNSVPSQSLQSTQSTKSTQTTKTK
jgi:hypothetical protein